jgi:hypothetical protein
LKIRFDVTSNGYVYKEDMLASHVFMNAPHCFVTDGVHLFLLN